MLHLIAVAFCVLLVAFVFCASAYVTVFAFIGLNSRLYFPHVVPQTRFLVLVPAHNESRGLVPTIRSLQHANYPVDFLRLAVIADNCSDDTAEVARACGVEVWTRSDVENPGKGQALSWALDKAALPFDLAAIIDADTEVDEDFFSAMNSAYVAQLQQGHANVVLQGKYLFAPAHPAPSWFEQFTLASKSAENIFSYRPRTALGLTNLIQGNGFCISHGALAQVPFESGSIVEDAEYAITLALNRVPVIYVDQAVVTSRMTRTISDATPQRLRWAAGVFALISQSVPQLVRASLQQHRWQLLEVALMLILTSRLILVYATVGAVALFSISYPFAHSHSIFGLLIAATALEALYLHMLLRHNGDSRLPLSVIACMPLYFGFLGTVHLRTALGFRRQIWSRTNR